MKKKLSILISVLIILLVALLGFCGYLGYKSFMYSPQKVRITNVTDSSFTVSWLTDHPMKGVVYYKDIDSFLPGPLAWVGANKAFDERDFVDAQSDCIEKFNSKVSETIDTEFAMDTVGYNCEEVSVSRYGEYYVHHVTLRGLEDDKKYYFRVGDRFFSWDISSGEYLQEEVSGIGNFEAQTKVSFTNIPVPSPAYGTVYNAFYNEDDVITESTSFDSLVFVRVFDGETELGTFSAVSNREGGWSIDLSNLRYEDGSLVNDIGELDLLFIPQVKNLPPVFSRVFDYGNITFPLHLLGNEESSWEREVEGSSTRLEMLMEKIVGEGRASTECEVTTKLVSKSCEIGDCFYEKRIDGTGEICGYEKAEDTTDCRPWYCMNVYSRPDDANYIPVKDEVTGEIILNYVPDKENIPDNETDIFNAGIELMQELGLGYYTIEKVLEGVGNANGSSCGYIMISVPGDPYDEDFIDYCKETCNQNEEGFFSSKRDCESSLSTDAHFCVKYDSEHDRCRYIIQDTCDINKGEFSDVAQCRNVHPINSEPPSSGEYYFDGVECVSTTYVTGSGIYSTQEECELAHLIINATCPSAYIKKQINVGGSLLLKCVHTLDYNTWLEECEDKNHYSDSIIRVLDGSDSNKVMHMTLKCPIKKYTIAINISEGKVQKVRDGTYGCCRKNIGTTEIYIIQQGGDGCDRYYTSIENCGESVKYKPFYCLERTTHEITPYLFNPNEEGKDRCQGDSQKINNNTDTINGVNCCELASGDSFIGSCASSKRLKWYRCVDIKSPEEVIINYSPGNFLEKFTNQIYAEEVAYGEDNSFLYFPDSGVYEVELLNGESLSLFGDNKSNYFFYYDRDGIEGYQTAIDPSNPEVDEDIIIHASSAIISMTQTTSARQIPLKKGINILSFDFLPSQGEKEPLQAEELMNLVNRGEDRVSKITYFNSGSWNGGLVYDFETGIVRGTSFPLIFGKGYILIAEMDTMITIPGYEINSSIPLAFSSGWNLIGVNGYTQTFTARTLIDSVNNVSGLTADNVTWWPTSKGMYEGLQVSESTEYGFDYPISTSNGYFVRISNFEPTDTTCKSLIWHPDGELHGQCGNN